MAIFPHAEIEGTVQVNDMTRIDATKSFISKGEADVTLIEIEPVSGNGFIDVTGSSSKDWYLDWEYPTDGTATVSVRITTDGAPTTEVSTLEVLSIVDDMLYSTDKDIMSIEPNILKFNGGAAREGRNSFLDVHREAQSLILDYLDEVGFRNTDDTRITKDQLIDSDEVKKWSKFLTLSLIYQGVSNGIGDVFDLKSSVYKSKAMDARNRATFRIDFNKDSEISSDEIRSFKDIYLVRR